MLMSGQRQDPSSGRSTFQDNYAAKQYAKFREHQSPVLISPPGLGNSLCIGGRVLAQNYVGTNIVKSSRTSICGTTGDLAQLTRNHARHPQVLGSNPACQGIIEEQNMQLCILIDTTGLEDHIYPRNFVSQDTHPETRLATGTTPEAPDCSRHILCFTLSGGKQCIINYLIGDVSVPTLSSLKLLRWLLNPCG